MSGRPTMLQPRPARVLAFLRERATADGRVPRLSRAEACAILGLGDGALAAALTALCTLGLAEREEGRFSPDGMTPALRLTGGDAVAPAGSGLADFGLDVTTYRPRFGEPISLPRVRWLEAHDAAVRQEGAR